MPAHTNVFGANPLPPIAGALQDPYSLSETDILAIQLSDKNRVRTPLPSVIPVDLAARPKDHRRRYRIDLR